MHYNKKTITSLSFLPLLATLFFISIWLYADHYKEVLFNTTNEASTANYLSSFVYYKKSVSDLAVNSSTEENISESTGNEITTINEIPKDIKAPLKAPLFQYIIIADSCNHEYEGKECVEAYPEPRPGIPPVARFRQGIVLRVDGEITYDGMTWYKVTFEDQTLHHPERLINDWYVFADDVEVINAKGEQSISTHGSTPTDKHIVVDLSDQMLYAYDGDTLFMEASVSTGLELASTPLGEHEVHTKMPSRYMQGPNPDVASSFYDLPGVPWNLYFTNDGAVIHGAYWHTSFGTPYSHGCINMTTEESKKLYDWTPLGTKVLVQE